MITREPNEITRGSPHFVCRLCPPPASFPNEVVTGWSFPGAVAALLPGQRWSRSSPTRHTGWPTFRLPARQSVTTAGYGSEVVRLWPPPPAPSSPHGRPQALAPWEVFPWASVPGHDGAQVLVATVCLPLPFPS